MPMRGVAAMLEVRLFDHRRIGQISLVQPDSILLASNRKRLRQFARTVRKPDREPLPIAPLMHELQTGKRLESPNQHTSGRPFPIRDYVQALMHAVDEVDIRVPAGPNRTLVRSVFPLDACAAKSASPRYASVSTIIPAAVPCRSTHPSRLCASSVGGPLEVRQIDRLGSGQKLLVWPWVLKRRARVSLCTRCRFVMQWQNTLEH